ncbi:GNAT family N-acetyltransferase [Streptomyces sp. CC210A]|uniref:GNAT family N-acetyltransferase n=1 Tax=Streptomyces sp. CC210A TaxID=2898184 RepID=UPI001F43EE44|nr:GNAT family N-acetyltransferase [Streptomyces sp. CC210A]
MTTTLRPTGPLQESADGTRFRAYEVCVNSRPVGAVSVGTDPGFGRRVGTISGLRVDEADRRRGRATVAALAAEEVLRGWRCELVRVSVPAGATVALHLARTLGYTERSRSLAKDLPPDAAAWYGSPMRPMTQEEYDRWRAAAEDAYARTWRERGVPEEAAEAKSRADHAALLPDGFGTEGAVFRVAEDPDGRTVGWLWAGLRGETGDPAGRLTYVWDVHVAEETRGRGYGRALMSHAEWIAREEHGTDRLGLHVFTDNTPALRLYESLGYRPAEYHFDKRLL